MFKILFIIHNRTSITELLPLAVELQKISCYEVLFYIWRVKEQMRDGLEECYYSGISYELGNIARRQLDSSLGSVDRVNLLGMKRFPGLRAISYLTHFYRVRKRELADARRVFQVHQPSILIMGEQALSGFETKLCQIAYQQEIDSLVVPYETLSPRAVFEAVAHYPDFLKTYSTSNFFNYMMAKLYSQWTVHCSGERRFVSEAPNRILVDQMLGAACPTGAFPGRKSSHYFAVDGQQLYDRYLELGVPAKQVVITGKPLHDVLAFIRENAAQFREELYQEFGISRERRMILFAVPQLAEHGLVSWAEHWRIIDLLLKALTSVSRACVILNLHPRSDSGKYAHLEVKYGVYISDKRVAKLIPLSDLYVAVSSSTVAMAIVSQVPVVNLEVWINSGAYEIDGVVNVYEEAEIGSVFQNVMQPEEYIRLKSAITQSSKSWGVIDGKALERLVGLVNQLVGKCV